MRENEIYTDLIKYVKLLINRQLPSSIEQLSWNDTDGTLDIAMGFDAVVQQVGMEQYYPPCVNKTASPIPNGTIVMVDPDHTVLGQRFRIKPLVADGTLPARLALGMTTMDIPVNQTGLVTRFGYVRTLSLRALQPEGETWVEGEILYASDATDGGLTNTMPLAPSLKIPCAVITRLNGNNIDLFVRFGNSYELGELHNVNITNPQTGDILQLDSNGVWVNVPVSSIIPN